MQFIGLLQLLGWISIIFGILILCMAFMKMTNTSETGGYETKTESKGVILIGPIPIVWGYGKRGWLIAGIIGIILFIVLLLVFN
ncbi:DUF131 domain-containing protein [Candidatus Thorarchaeota archaeon]|nr:MAG: DUF131 domain-containing protein [Candidatus Thorarchaeota archaeon]